VICSEGYRNTEPFRIKTHRQADYLATRRDIEIQSPSRKTFAHCPTNKNCPRHIDYLVLYSPDLREKEREGRTQDVQLSFSEFGDACDYDIVWTNISWHVSYN